MAAILRAGVRVLRSRQAYSRGHRTANMATAVDPQAAFPTAALAAQLRALDSKTPAPLIGSNIGGNPDHIAEVFAGDLGVKFCEDYAGRSVESHTLGMASRTMYYDGLLMEALDQGCKQFVLLGAGLDGRAWRLPRLDESVKVFEVDVERCMTYKAEKVASFPTPLTMLTCTRVVVEADLCDPTWTAKLVASGFDPTQRSFFLAEGLLMFFPPDAIPSFLRSVSSMIGTGTFAACCFVGFIDSMASLRQDLRGKCMKSLEKHGTRWVFDATSEANLRSLFDGASLPLQSIISSADAFAEFVPDSYGKRNAAQTEQPPDVDEAHVGVHATKVMETITALRMWSIEAISWLRTMLAMDGGPHMVAQVLVDDAPNQIGLRDCSKSHKARVVEVLMGQGFAQQLVTIMSEFNAKTPHFEYAATSVKAGVQGYCLAVATKP